MAHIPVKAQAGSQPEYSVYIYHRPENQIEGQSDWEMRAVNSDFGLALSEARRLYKSQNFKKVEIKQRIENVKTNSVSDLTLKILEPGLEIKKFKLVLICSAILLAALFVCAVIAVQFSS